MKRSALILSVVVTLVTVLNAPGAFAAKGEKDHDRSAYANKLERYYLEHGVDMRITAEDHYDDAPNHTYILKKVLVFQWYYMNKSVAYNILKGKNTPFKKALKILGIEQVHFIAVRSNHPELNSYVYYVQEQKLYRVWGKDEGLYIE